MAYSHHSPRPPGALLALLLVPALGLSAIVGLAATDGYGSVPSGLVLLLGFAGLASLLFVSIWLWRETFDSEAEPTTRPTVAPVTGETGITQPTTTEPNAQAPAPTDSEPVGRADLAATFQSVGRRLQQLVYRQNQALFALQGVEGSEEIATGLVTLHQIGARMNRTSQSLLVLAGDQRMTRRGSARSMADTVDQAVGQLEGSRRMEVAVLDEDALPAGVSSDLVHLLAELLENAAAFSPPTRPIAIVGKNLAERDEHAYVLTVTDEGLGMSEPDRAEANRRLTGAVEVDDAGSDRLGLLVVAQLAQRHGIEVELLESDSGGIVARVLLPANLLVEQPARRPPLVERPPPRPPHAPLGPTRAEPAANTG